MFYLIAFLITFFFNLYIIIWDGKKDLQKLKENTSIRKYLSEINQSISEVFGQYAKVFRIVLILLVLSIVIFNAFFFLGCILAIILGTYAAKKAHEVPFSSNIINKIATYINRIR